MNRKNILIPIFLLFTFSGFGQAFEIYNLEKFNKDPETKPIQNGNYADINSTLYIDLDKDYIAEAIREFSGTDTIATYKLRLIKLVLKNHVEILKLYKIYAEDGNLESLNDLAEEMNTFFTEANKYEEIRAMYNKYSNEYFTKYASFDSDAVASNEIPDIDQYIFLEMAKRADELADSIRNNIDSEKVSFLLSGRMATSTGARDIKLSDDFDNFVADSYTVSRWQTKLNAEGKKQLKQIGELSTTLNNLMVAKSPDIKNWLKDSFDANNCIKDIENRLDSLPQAVSTLAPQLRVRVKNIVKQSIAQAEALGLEYLKNKTKASNLNSLTSLKGIKSDLTGAADSIKSLISSMDGQLISFLDSLPSNPEIEVFISTYNSCKKELIADKKKILKVVNKLSALFEGSKNSLDAASELSDQIKRLSFDAIPEDSQIDLKNTGQRANGDQIRIIAVLEEPAKAGAQPIRRTIQRMDFKVQQIGLYSRVRPLLLLANPIGDVSNVNLAGKKFQFAPSYSLLFKYGSRTSKAINEIWQPSIGVNFGALDFNADAVPEFSAALEFTFLRDYFSVGYGFNFGEDIKYFMIGFRIPVGALSLPMFNDIQSTGGLD